MAIDLAKLVARLELQSAQFQSELEKSNRKLARFAKDSRNSLSNIERGANALLGSIKRAAGGIVAAFSVGAIVGSIKNAINLGDELNKAAIKAGLGGKAISELAFAAKQADIDLGSLSSGISKMQRAISEAITGGKSQKEVFDALGISLNEIKGIQADRQFELIADKISQLKDPTDRTRAAVEIFGKSGADLLPLFEQGAEGIKKAREEAQRLGLSFSDETLKRLADADDAVKKLKASFDGLAVTLTAKIAPGLTRFFDSISAGLSGKDYIPALEDRIKQIEFLIKKGDGLSAEGFYYLDREKEELEARIAKARGPLTNNGSGSNAQATPATSKTPPGFAAADAARKYSEDIKKYLDETSAYSASIAEDAERDAEAESERLSKEYENQMDVRYKQMGLDDEYLENRNEFYKELEDSTKTSFEKQVEAIKDFQTRLDILVADGLDPKIADKRMKEFKKSFDEMSVYADQAARNIQSAFADFLFDPFEDGLKGMLKGFIDVVRRMVAEMAAAQIFGSKEKGGLGLGDIISGGLGAIFGGGGGGIFGGIGSGPTNTRLPGATPPFSPLATGSNFIPRDNFPALLHRGEAVVPARYNPAAGGAMSGIVINNNIDARGATKDAIAALPEVLQRNNDALEAKIVDGIRRGRYALA